MNKQKKAFQKWYLDHFIYSRFLNRNLVKLYFYNNFKEYLGKNTSNKWLMAKIKIKAYSLEIKTSFQDIWINRIVWKVTTIKKMSLNGLKIHSILI